MTIKKIHIKADGDLAILNMLLTEPEGDGWGDTSPHPPFGSETLTGIFPKTIQPACLIDILLTKKYKCQAIKPVGQKISSGTGEKIVKTKNLKMKNKISNKDIVYDMGDIANIL